MRIIFIGTPEFASYSLKKLHESGKNIVAVITAPDKKAGRGQQLRSSAVKQYAVDHNIPCLQPNNLKDPEFIEDLKDLNADLQIVVAFRMLPEVVWNMPPLGTMNLHASLLPNYRGAAPINWAIMNGENATGLSTFFLKHEIDTGEILLQKEVPVEKKETAGSLHDKLMIEGAELLLSSVNLIETGEYKTTSQLEMVPEGMQLSELPLAPKIFREDCHIIWNNKVDQLDQFIRGLSPYPAAWTSLKRKSDGKELNLKIFETKVHKDLKEHDPGSIYHHNGKLFISANDGVLEILDLQLEGKKRMNSRDFLNGIKLEDYEEAL